MVRVTAASPFLNQSVVVPFQHLLDNQFDGTETNATASQGELAKWRCAVRNRQIRSERDRIRGGGPGQNRTVTAFAAVLQTQAWIPYSKWSARTENATVCEPSEGCCRQRPE